jgi:hypothetical protein
VIKSANGPKFPDSKKKVFSYEIQYINVNKTERLDLEMFFATSKLGV